MTKNKNKNKNNKKQSLQKIKICTIIISLIALISISVVVCLAVCGVFKNRSDESSAEYIDYDQLVTSEDGSEFNSTYDANSGESFSVRFSNLSCTENCENVSTVFIGDEKLTKGEDYEVKEGSVIIILFSKIMQRLSAGTHDLTVELTENGVNKKFGVKITVKKDNKEGKEDKENKKDKEDEKEAQSAKMENTTKEEKSNNTKKDNVAEVETKKEDTKEQESTANTTNNNEVVQKTDINLNDNYKVDYFGMHLYAHDKDGNAIIDANGRVKDSFTYGSCGIKRNNALIKTTYFVSTKNYAITKAQQDAEVSDAIARGLKGEGGGYQVDLNEQYCGICRVSCGRW